MITRKKGTKKARDDDGRYKKECGCLIHEPNDAALINIKKGKKINVRIRFQILSPQVTQQKSVLYLQTMQRQCI